MKTRHRLSFIANAALTALILYSAAPPLCGGVALQIGQNFTGSTDSDTFYPDTSGGAGADDFVEFSDHGFAVYSKADGSVLQTMTWLEFWTQAGVTIPSTYDYSTARVVHDPTVQRWFIAQTVGDATAQVLLAISAAEDPTGAWNGVLIPGAAGTNSTAFTVNLGLDAQGVYLSAPFASAGSKPVSWTLVSLPKADLLLIPPVISNRTSSGLLSAANYGYNLEPAISFDGSAGGDLLATGGRGNPGEDNTNLLALAVEQAGEPGPATFSAPAAISVPASVNPRDALQPDGSTNLFTPNASFWANVYGVGGVLFATADTQVGTRPAIRWYRVRATDHALLESGTISDPNLDIYNSSIAANTNGTVVIACSGSSTDTFASCYAAVGQTVNGVTTFGNLLLLKAGVASYQNLDLSTGENDWGRYSTTCVDPADSNVFWTINTFAAGPTTWSTQITQLLTSPSPQLSIASTAGGLLLSWPVPTVPFQMETAPSLPGIGSWAPLSQVPTTNGTTASVLVPATNAGAFFRLKQQ